MFMEHWQCQWVNSTVLIWRETADNNDIYKGYSSNGRTTPVFTVI